jgi:uncharacterized membrane protein YidH (DUF202 family)
MQSLYQVLGLIGAALIIWVLYRNIKNRPEQFSRQNLSKSASSMGILALILIVFVAFLVLLVKHT